MRKKCYEGCLVLIDIEETCLITNLTLVGFYTHKEIKAKLTIDEDISFRWRLFYECGLIFQ